MSGARTSLLLVLALALAVAFNCVAGAELPPAKSKNNDAANAESSPANKEEDAASIEPLLMQSQKNGQERAEKNDYILIWIKPWEQFMPEQIKDMINSQIRPQTEQISSQISNVPGAEQWYQIMSQLQNTFGNMAGGASGGSNPLSGFMGRRR